MLVLITEPTMSKHSLPVHFNGYFPDGSGLAGTRTSPLWILLELRVMEVVVTTGPIRCAKLQSIRHHQQTGTQFDTHPTPTEGKKSGSFV